MYIIFTNRISRFIFLLKLQVHNVNLCFGFVIFYKDSISLLNSEWFCSSSPLRWSKININLAQPTKKLLETKFFTSCKVWQKLNLVASNTKMKARMKKWRKRGSNTQSLWTKPPRIQVKCTCFISWQWNALGDWLFTTIFWL